MSKTLQTRVDNLRRLVDAFGGVSAVSQKLGRANSSYLSQLVGPNPSRNIGERAARKIEADLGLPEMWLDVPNADLVRLGDTPAASVGAAVIGGRVETRRDVAAYGRPTAGASGLRERPMSDYLTGPEIAAGPRDLPVFGSFQGGFDGSEINYENPVDVIERPAELVGVRNACAVYIVNDSMEPRYFRGEMALVHPGRPVRQGDFVAVELANGRGLIKRLIRRTDDFVELEQYNPPEKRKIPRKEIAGVYLIIGTRHDR